MSGTKGSHINQDTFDGVRPPTNTPVPPKMINAGDPKVGPRKASPAWPGNLDTFSE